MRQILKSWLASQRYKWSGGEFVSDPSRSLKAAIQWLCAAQDATGCGGFSNAYSLLNGWGLPYPEITGYIIPTLLASAGLFPELNLRERAKKAGAWLNKVQLDCGALCTKQYRPDNKAPSVFNTGMGLHGWISLYELESDERSLSSARLAAEWLVKQQEKDGSWIKYAFNRIPHTYYTMVDWALLRFHRLTHDGRYHEAAVRNLNWVLRNQRQNGWFDHCALSIHEPVTTHTLSYTTQGLLESGKLIGASRYIEAARLGTQALLDYFEKFQKLPGSFDCDWQPTAGWECLTGNAQTSVVWKSLAILSGDKSWREAADGVDEKMLSCQKTGCRTPGINGGISGSWPIDGAYDPYAFPSHAAKFYTDALLLN